MKSLHNGNAIDRALARTALPKRSADVLPLIERNPTNWRDVLLELLKLHNWAHGSKPKGVSYKTMEERKLFLFSFFRELRQDPDKQYRIDPRSLGRRHIEHAVRRWVQRGLSPATIQTYLSYLRVFSTWIGKAGLVVEATAYTDDPALVKRTYNATCDKSWSGNDVDIEEILNRVDLMDARVGAQLRMCDAFGLRVKESLMLRPQLAVIENRLSIISEEACESYLEVLRGTKGGRLRVIPIESACQIAAIEHAKGIVRTKHESLANPSLRLHQAYAHFYYVLQKAGISKASLGVTVHGLRHGYGHRRFEALAGSAPPLLGGTARGAEVDHARRKVSSELGHDRVAITNVYLGAPASPSSEASNEEDSQ